MMSVRLEKLRSIMQESHLDAVALVPGSTFRYLAGSVHHLNERPIVLVIPREGRPAAVMPNLEVELFSSHGFDAELVQWHDADGYDSAFQQVVKLLRLDGKTIGVEGQRMRFFEGEALRRHAPNANVFSADKQIAKLRLHKDAEAIAALRKAIQISEQALEATLQAVQVGMTELQIATLLERHMSDLGGEGIAFTTTVLAGENSARPHGMVRSDYYLQAGEPLLFDFGATYGGYNADITRTFFVKSVSDEHRAIYETVKKANAAGREAVKPGVTAEAVDLTTLQVLKDDGFESLIVHKTGHGLGMDVHEEPYIMRGNLEKLEPGMVFTVEPGLYKPGSIGVRIEDNVVVTDSGVDTLTTFDRDLRIIG
ncbi:MAG: Xaa-Pro peptidase family protein [Anaerolineae bacterium]|nr:Xaa-Pro peptidase family protein [Anaerolineae bacterium]